jgi:hypothetical protein
MPWVVHKLQAHDEHKPGRFLMAHLTVNSGQPINPRTQSDLTRHVAFGLESFENTDNSSARESMLSAKSLDAGSRVPGASRP